MLLTQGVVAYDICHPKEMLQMEHIINSRGVLIIFTDNAHGSLNASGTFQNLWTFI